MGHSVVGRRLIEEDAKRRGDVVATVCAHPVKPATPKFCSDACRQAAYRTRKAVKA
jgi:hypothetical protein